MNKEYLAALLDLRIALGALQVVLENLDKAIRELMRWGVE